MLVLLAALLAATGPNALGPDDVCLTGQACATDPAYCLVRDARCEQPHEPLICLVDDCGERWVRPPLQP